MLEFFKSTVGRKYLMGLTGLIWMGFILTHMAGNMLILVSADAYNAYGHAIVSNKLLLYGTEIVLVLALIVHVYTAISLTIRNRSSRGPTRYAMHPNAAKAASLGSKWMAVQGTAILAFIILHLATFKYGTVYETTVNGVPMRDLHKLVLEVFQSPGYVAWYVVALILLLFHVRHGATSVFQSFGVLERRMQGGIKKFAWGYAVIVIAGFLSQPLYVFLTK
jgi:succinate dehydrogenase / fumarate reductase cytochrome b subunit